mmetsp:Transcript_26661/g.39606  ORF Transcript_26661/g.39606 Transcript_26661/m.39606 type:complete len:654 (-) Transcript_26661:137-2098(-)|eukprot:CAMPEP_0185033908 /NCGR_PEP_ID=MMETSP1103-20130426/23322_1 /TAXON_ID=36769 /ORGANISM="Paraphysomonas bandaiensis, Strain Caron Lab Isolate" /LENGTH=653 /DNA_ID=CAMNT_0027570353 /DNA_START=46 /DNA_END=2007 /DNA_ORIENTATION=-
MDAANSMDGLTLSDRHENKKSAEKKSRSLYAPTQSMIAAQKELERRKVEVNPVDDPFWEKRGGKGAQFYPKFREVPEKPPRSMTETLEHVSPLPASSRLLSPTKAYECGTYQKQSPKKPKLTAKLPENSHLLTPTKASSCSEYSPPPKPSPSSQSRSRRGSGDSTTLQLSTSPNGTRLFDLTATRKQKVIEKRGHNIDPREQGWKSNTKPDNKESPNYTKPSVPNAYKDVKSKLLNPTVASVRQQWTPEKQEGSEDDVGEVLDPVPTGCEVKKHTGHTNHAYDYVGSRLHESTTSNKASMWTGAQQESAPVRVNKVPEGPPPNAALKETKAQQYSKREKYTKPATRDIREVDKQEGRVSRVSPVPHQPGRMYVPPQQNSRNQAAKVQSESVIEPVPISGDRPRLTQIFQPASSTVEDIENPMLPAEEENSPVDYTNDTFGNSESARFTDESEVVALEDVLVQEDEKEVAPRSVSAFPESASVGGTERTVDTTEDVNTNNVEQRTGTPVENTENTVDSTVDVETTIAEDDLCGTTGNADIAVDTAVNDTVEIAKNERGSGDNETERLESTDVNTDVDETENDVGTRFDTVKSENNTLRSAESEKAIHDTPIEEIGDDSGANKNTNNTVDKTDAETDENMHDSANDCDIDEEVIT